MKLRFARTADPRAALAFVVEKGGLDRIAEDVIGRSAIDTLIGAARASRFDGEPGTIVESFVTDGEAVRRLVLIGAGSGSEADFERAGGALTARLLTSGAVDVAVSFDPQMVPSALAVARFAAAAIQRGWRHDLYRTRLPDKSKPTLETIVLLQAPDGSEAEWRRHDAVTQGLALTRMLVAEPPNILYPESFVSRVVADVEGLGIEIGVLDEAGMAAAGMGALLGVSQGSRREARLLTLNWRGGGGAGPAVAFVGKGVTFDSGGISLKAGAGMEDMKWDMGGAGAVVGAMKALAMRHAAADVIGVCGLVENMPDGAAQRPGDVVTSMSGQTIEIINTDAEGRLVLCDALTWVQREYRPKTIVDLATLTGAMIVSLGSEHGGCFANDDELAEQLLAAGRATGDLLWRLPLSPAYDKLIDSPIADMKNVGPRGAGSITAAQFIQRFVDPGVRWAHLDIAGMVWADKPGTTFDKGATGYGVRLLDRFVADQVESSPG